MVDDESRRKSDRRRDEIVRFVAEVGRKSSKRNGFDPNDRHFDPEFSRRLRKMPPEEFDRVVRDEDE